MKKQVGLWIDHQETIIMSIGEQGEETSRIESGMEKHVRFSDGSGSKEGSTEDGRDRQFTGHLNNYYDEVISHLGREATHEEIAVLNMGVDAAVRRRSCGVTCANRVGFTTAVNRCAHACGRIGISGSTGARRLPHLRMSVHTMERPQPFRDWSRPKNSISAIMALRFLCRHQQIRMTKKDRVLTRTTLATAVPR